MPMVDVFDQHYHQHLAVDLTNRLSSLWMSVVHIAVDGYVLYSKEEWQLLMVTQ